MPPQPKNPKTRQRRNKPATAAKLLAEHDLKAPPLPEIKGRSWGAQTRAWWKDIWASPMAPEFLKADSHGLFSLALLVDDFWAADTASTRKDLASEIRLQRQCFGLTPIDRRRLQWEVVKVEEAEKKRTKPAKQTGKGDVYGALHAV